MEDTDLKGEYKLMDEAINESVKEIAINSESAQSTSIVGYFKGYSVTLTNRNPHPDFSLQLEAVQKTINELDQDWKPSWNSETNKQATPKNEQWIDPTQQTELGKCPRCNAPMKLSKQGKPYCSAVCWKK